MSRILVIDDQHDNLVAASAMLKTHIAESTFLLARSGAEGLEKAKTESPDLILLDIAISDMDGYLLCKALKEQTDTAHIPIILMTAAKTDSEERVRGLEMGADAFLTTPINESELIAQVRVGLRVKKAEDQLRIDKYLLEKIIADRTKALEYSRRELTAKLQKEAEEKELHRSESRRLRLQKTEAIKTMASGIAHDFNNILAAIIGFAELADMNIPDGPARGHLKEILESGHRAKDLIRQMWNICRTEKEDLRPIRLTPIINERIQSLKSSPQPNIEIRHQITEIADMIMADASQLRQMLTVLCNNAYEAMKSKGGVLEIELSAFKAENLEPTEFRSGDYVKLVIRDTGVGIAPELTDRIFDPYFTTKDRYDGSGLGLAVVQGIVRRFGGAIRVQSKVGKGSAFEIILPCIGDQIQEKSEKQATDTRPLPKGNEKIMVVDDETLILNLVQQMLYRLGYDVVIASNPFVALEMFKKAPKSFDLVMTDMKMPDLNGQELAKEIFSIRADIPIILCTGVKDKISSSPDKFGIREVVGKPFAMRDIAYAIRRALGTEGD